MSLSSRQSSISSGCAKTSTSGSLPVRVSHDIPNFNRVAPPPSALRTLSTFPMDHDRRETLNAMCMYKDLASRRAENINQSKDFAQSLSHHCRSLFDDAIEVASRAPSMNALPRFDTNDSQAPSYCKRGSRSLSIPGERVIHSSQSSREPRSSGPSLYGSPIYNQRPQLLSDIRTRHNAKSASRPLHQCATSDIREILYHSNDRFRVLPIGTSSGTIDQWTPRGYHDYVLVPTRMDAEDLEDEESDSPATLLDDSIIFEDAEDEIAPLTPRDADDDPHQESISQDEDDTLAVQATEPAVTRNQPAADENHRICHSALSNGTQSSKSLGKRVTWVDDATVSSPPPDVAMEEDGEVVGDVCPIYNDGANVGKISEKSVVVNLNDLQENEWSLPDFICPTSEEKSKEARMKHWLKNNTFTWSSRSVPLL